MGLGYLQVVLCIFHIQNVVGQSWYIVGLSKSLKNNRHDPDYFDNKFFIYIIWWLPLTLIWPSRFLSLRSLHLTN